MSGTHGECSDRARASFLASLRAAGPARPATTTAGTCRNVRGGEDAKQKHSPTVGLNSRSYLQVVDHGVSCPKLGPRVVRNFDRNGRYKIEFGPTLVPRTGPGPSTSTSSRKSAAVAPMLAQIRAMSDHCGARFPTTLAPDFGALLYVWSKLGRKQSGSVSAPSPSF